MFENILALFVIIYFFRAGISKLIMTFNDSEFMIQSLFLARKSRQICGNFPTIVQSKNHHRLGHFNTKIAPKAHQKDNYNYRAPQQSPTWYCILGQIFF